MFVWTDTGKEVEPVETPEGLVYLSHLPHWIAHLLELGQIVFVIHG